jgi:hypothetical protein
MQSTYRNILEQRIGVMMQKVKRFFSLDEFSRRGKGRPETSFSLIRNQQVEGSNPPAGSRDIKELAEEANSIIILG